MKAAAETHEIDQAELQAAFEAHESQLAKLVEAEEAQDRCSQIYEFVKRNIS